MKPRKVANYSAVGGSDLPMVNFIKNMAFDDVQNPQEGGSDQPQEGGEGTSEETS